MPCRISVYEDEGRTHLASVRPTLLFDFFELPQLADKVREIEESITRILDAAADEEDTRFY